MSFAYQKIDLFAKQLKECVTIFLILLIVTYPDKNFNVPYSLFYLPEF